MTRSGPKSVVGLAVPLTAIAVACGAVLLTGGAAALPAGVPDPGSLARWGLPMLKAMHDVAAAGTIGLLVLAAVLVPAQPGSRGRDLGATGLRATRAAGAGALVWAGAGFGVLVLSYADLSGVSPFSSGFTGQLRFFITEFDLGRSYAVSALMAGAVAAGCLLVIRVSSAGLLALAALVALFPLALTGHSSGDANHGNGVTLQAAHVVGVSVWVGGLAALLLLRPHLGAAGRVVATRYSRLAGWCFAVVAISGVGNAVLRLDGWSGLRSDYGALLIAKVCVLIVIAAIAVRQRRALLSTAVDAVTTGQLLHLARVEVILLATAVGLGVALSRTSPGSTDESELLPAFESPLGYPVPAELTRLGWLTAWRTDLMWLSVAGLAAGWYVRAVIQLHRRGDRWPVLRLLSWVAGCVLLVWATNGAPGAYGRVLFSMHMVSHMTIAMLVPVLLVLAAPVTLALRTLPSRADGSRGPREWLLVLVHARAFRLLAWPPVAAGNFVISLVLFYNTGLFELALRTHAGHVLMTAHFLLAGYVFAWVICGPDPGPERPPYVFRVMLLLGTFAFHAFFGLAQMSSTTVLAESWFAAIPREWGPSLLADQQRGGGFAWGFGDIPVVVMALALGRAWLTADRREARRLDRRADRDGDADLQAYNAYLARLAEGAPAPRTDGWVPKIGDHR
ncbi:bifunctional copper resistance protein CopD/cytochrome c oxidase assembly protein [Sporichthya polymorpha]|uniref:bifunctional copper resistance protein CopD/cytochrome c oxidase assembly protein n=1 Tax=Sporichthya polymorpha TaxID=35751 RepID=UPI00039E250D|nr:bifunctional copper resistance protein CopD/cytochrome c oxidase assembly protein [Sporichthya polymorpha]